MSFRTRSVSGRWAHGGARRPRPRIGRTSSREVGASRGWRVGNPWTKPVGSDPGSSEGRRPPRAGLPRPQPGAARADADAVPGELPGGHPAAVVERERADHAAAVVRLRPPLRARPARPARTGARRRNPPRSCARSILPRPRERLERYGLQLPRRQVRPGLRGPRGRGRQKRRRCARRGVQHRVSRLSRCSGTTPGPRSRGRTRRDCTAARLAPRPGARRPAVLAVVPSTGILGFLPARRSSCRRSRATGTRGSRAARAACSTGSSPASRAALPAADYGSHRPARGTLGRSVRFVAKLTALRLDGRGLRPERLAASPGSGQSGRSTGRGTRAARRARTHACSRPGQLSGRVRDVRRAGAAAPPQRAAGDTRRDLAERRRDRRLDHDRTR